MTRREYNEKLTELVAQHREYSRAFSEQPGFDKEALDKFMTTDLEIQKLMQNWETLPSPEPGPEVSPKA